MTTRKSSSITYEQFDAFVQEVREWQESVNKMLAELPARIKAVETRVEENREMVNQDRKTLFGNGEIGMDERVRNIHDYIKGEKERRKREADQRQWLQRALAGVVIANAAAMLGAALVWLWKIVPLLNSIAAEAAKIH